MGVIGKQMTGLCGKHETDDDHVIVQGNVKSSGGACILSAEKRGRSRQKDDKSLCQTDDRHLLKKRGVK